MLVVDTPVHHIALVCDSPSHRSEAPCISLVTGSRDECNRLILEAGWRLDGKKHLCPACVKERESKRQV